MIKLKQILKEAPAPKWKKNFLPSKHYDILIDNDELFLSKVNSAYGVDYIMRHYFDIEYDEDAYDYLNPEDTEHDEEDYIYQSYEGPWHISYPENPFWSNREKIDTYLDDIERMDQAAKPIDLRKLRNPDEDAPIPLLPNEMYFGKIRDAKLLQKSKELFPDLNLSIFIFYVGTEGELGLVSADEEYPYHEDTWDSEEEWLIVDDSIYLNQNISRKFANLLGVSKYLVNSYAKRAARNTYNVNSGDSKIFNGSLFINKNNIKNINLKNIHAVNGSLTIDSIQDSMIDWSSLYEVKGDVVIKNTKIKSLNGFHAEIAGDLDIENNKSLTSLEGLTATVERNFYCSENNLTSLKGCPEIVKEHFGCSDNKLKTLEGGPKEVGGSYTCSYNPLTSLKGAPEKVVGKMRWVGFDCTNTALTSLEGAPRIAENFNCSYNSRLTSLKGAPVKVKNSFLCYHSKLTTLEGGPTLVGLNYNCSNNKLVTLKGAPREAYNFTCENNQLTSLKGAPVKVKKTFDCRDNPLISLEGCPKEVNTFWHSSRFTEEEIRAVCNVKGKVENMGATFSTKSVANKVAKSGGSQGTYKDVSIDIDKDVSKQLATKQTYIWSPTKAGLNEFISNIKSYSLKEFFFNKKSK
jgi:hypothetical protein